MDQIRLRWGQANVRRWSNDIVAVLQHGDLIDAAGLVTHERPLSHPDAKDQQF